MIDNGLPIMEKIVDQFENLKDPKALREKFEQGIDKSTKLTQEQKEALKKGAKDAFQFDGQSLATNKDKIIKMKSKIALEIARTEKENGGLKTMKQKVKFFASETKRRVQGLSKPRVLVKAAKAGSMMTGMVGKFLAASQSDPPP